MKDGDLVMVRLYKKDEGWRIYSVWPAILVARRPLIAEVMLLGFQQTALVDYNQISGFEPGMLHEHLREQAHYFDISCKMPEGWTSSYGMSRDELTDDLLLRGNTMGGAIMHAQSAM